MKGYRIGKLIGWKKTIKELDWKKGNQFEEKKLNWRKTIKQIIWWRKNLVAPEKFHSVFLVVGDSAESLFRHSKHNCSSQIIFASDTMSV